MVQVSISVVGGLAGQRRALRRQEEERGYWHQRHHLLGQRWGEHGCGDAQGFDCRRGSKVALNFDKNLDFSQKKYYTLIVL